MPVDTRLLFRPDIVRSRMRGFELSEAARAGKTRLLLWAQWLDTPDAQTQTEESILAEFLNDIFGRLLGYRGPVTNETGHTMSREQFLEVDGSFADAVLGTYGAGRAKHLVAIEGKGPRDPLDRPFAGRRLSAVEQAYRYAINLPCDWILVTNLRELRLYHKGSDQRTLERFDTKAMAFDERQLRRFVFLLGAERVVAADGSCHLDELRSLSFRADVELTRAFYGEYAQLRRELLRALTAANIQLDGPRPWAPRSGSSIAYCLSPFARIGGCCLRTRSSGLGSTVIRTTRGQSGTTSEDCSRLLTEAASLWPFRRMTGGFSLTIRCSTSWRFPTPPASC